MNDKNKKSTKVIGLLAALILTVTILFSLTACSLFTDAVKGVFSGETSLLSKEDSSEAGKQGGSSSSGGEEQAPPSTGEDPEDTIVVDDPPIEVSGSIVNISTDLTYDKASRSDLTISATHENMNYYEVLGMGLINDGPAATVAVNYQTTGSSRVLLDGEYLSTLDAGYYYFYYVVSDSKAKLHYDPFRLTITNSVAKPSNLKIAYDIDCPSVYVTFRCDCGGDHVVTFDGSEYPVAAGATRARITKSVDKAASHSATVTCASSSQSSMVNKPSPDAAAYSNSYLSYKYSFLGHRADGFIEDDDEAADLLEYLAYAGEETDMKVYVSAAIHTLINSNASSYLASIQSKITVPWSLHFGLSYSSENKEVTFKVQNTNAGAVISTDYDDPRPSSDLASSYHVMALNTRNNGGELPIDKKKVVAVRNVKELLQAVEKGYCPEATDSTLVTYNKARAFCYTYLSDDMTDLEKLHVIYDYLAGEVDYDYSALNLFNLIATISQMERDGEEYVYVLSLDEAKDAIVNALAAAELESDPSKKFSSAMVEAINAAMDSVNAPQTTKDLVAALKVDYLQRLSAFSAEGVFDDNAAVCEGISYAFMLLARIEGIECYQITGVASQGNSRVAHAWNKVHLDGKWYCIDATWGNVYMGETKYVTHRYFMVDESVFDEDHKETIGDLGEGVKTLALGDVEYYKSVETTSGHSLYLSNNADLRAAVAYYLDEGSNYLEVLIDPVYKPSSTDFIYAYKAVTGKECRLSYSEGRVFIAYFIEA